MIMFLFVLQHFLYQFYWKFQKTISVNNMIEAVCSVGFTDSDLQLVVVVAETDP